MTGKNKPRPPLFLEPREGPEPLEGPFFLNDMTPRRMTAADIGQLANLRADEAVDEAVRGVVRPGGDARGKQKSDVADKWRKPAAALAEKIWLESPDLPIAIVGQRIWKSLPEDQQPPSDRALKDHIRPLKNSLR